MVSPLIWLYGTFFAEGETQTLTLALAVALAERHPVLWKGDGDSAAWPLSS